MAPAFPTMEPASMLSRLDLGVLLLLGVSTCGHGFAHGNSEGVCPKRQHERLQQIFIFDGKPEEMAYLAPDDDTGGTYTLAAIYKEGRTVTVRCQYDKGAVYDVELKRAVNKCKYSESRSGVPKLICK
jgi:hypothetical protein